MPYARSSFAVAMFLFCCVSVATSETPIQGVMRLDPQALRRTTLRDTPTRFRDFCEAPSMEKFGVCTS